MEANEQTEMLQAFYSRLMNHGAHSNDNQLVVRHLLTLSERLDELKVFSEVVESELPADVSERIFMRIHQDTESESE